MAQVIWAHLGRGHWQAFSAGSAPSGYVHPLALEALKEIGLPDDGLESKHVDQFADERIDLAVTVCDNARENCPVMPGAGQTLHWPFDDPADATGTDEEKMVVFRRVRDEIYSRIENYLESSGSDNSCTPAVGLRLDEPTARDCLALIRASLIEDTGSADLAEGVDCTSDSVVPRGAMASAAFVAREAGIVSGVEVVRLAIGNFAPELTLECRLDDGASVKKGDTIAVLSGPAHKILVIERTCLNFMCRLSGIATLTHRHVELVAGTGARVLDTRKTLPGYRRLEKYAVRCGGGTNHRMGLYDAVMIKDNHLAFYRSLVDDSEDTIPAAIELARRWIGSHIDSLPDGGETILQLEVDTLQQLEIALPCGPDIILLDNMEPERLREAVKMRDDAVSAGGKMVLLEASGGVNLDTIGEISRTGVERISVGALTHSAVNFDIGLDWTREIPA